jgi:hypothetical protein
VHLLHSDCGWQVCEALPCVQQALLSSHRFRALAVRHTCRCDLAGVAGRQPAAKFCSCCSEPEAVACLFNSRPLYSDQLGCSGLCVWILSHVFFDAISDSFDVENEYTP